MFLWTIVDFSDESAAPIFRVEDSASIFYSEHGEVYPNFILNAGNYLKAYKMSQFMRSHCRTLSSIT
jgi:hypothetical protein